MLGAVTGPGQVGGPLWIRTKVSPFIDSQPRKRFYASMEGGTLTAKLVSRVNNSTCLSSVHPEPSAKHTHHGETAPGRVVHVLEHLEVNRLQ